MRPISSALQTKLDSGVTTLARCWKLARRDGVVIGFTDHDSDLVMSGVTFRAGTGFTSSEAAGRFDLSVDGAEISGALADNSLTDADLAAGRYDAAAIETWLVDWSDPSLTVLTARGTLGEVRREGQAFVAELRGLADLLSQESGRLYTAKCGADLGDGRCKVDLTNPALRGAGAIAVIEGTSIFVASGLDGFADMLFSLGRLTWSSGANAGLAIEVKQHRLVGGHARLTLWQAMPEPIAAGDAFTVTAGCDKRFATCRARFANTDNFRGFPQIPGNDFLLASPTQGAPGNYGLSLVPPSFGG
jgi:uncharacterized phage protein (TIGR02218 family)